MPLWKTVFDLEAQADAIRRRRYGVIEAREGRVTSIRFRPWPKWVALPQALYFGPRRHRRWSADCCRLYFNQPRRFSNYLALPYAVSGNGTRLATIYAALAALDEVARIKRTDAILADIQNDRISARLLERQGWQPHAPSRWHRNHIKRFYGNYPAVGQASGLTTPQLAIAMHTDTDVESEPLRAHSSGHRPDLQQLNAPSACT
jgi:hypothetical protein